MTDTNTEGEPGGVIHEVFRLRAAEHPDATALVHQGSTVSYQTLDGASDAFAAELASAGVRAGDVVPLALPRSSQLVASLLAVLKLGAAYAVMDPRWPRSRVAELADRASAPVIVTAPENAQGWRRPTWTPSGDLRRAALTGRRPPVGPPVRESDTCSVFFTSGSTGRPKGVMSPHSGTTRLLAPARILRVGRGTVIPQAAALPWDAMSLELWSALLGGGTSVLVDEPVLTAEGLRKLVEHDAVDTLWLTASLFNMFVEEDLGCFEGIRQLLVGGERLSPPHIATFTAAYPDTVLTNGYGPVESAIFTTTHRVTSADCESGGEIPVGRAVPRTEVLVLDSDLRECPPEEVGEICVAGAGVAAGYLDDPELTARSFVTVETGGARHRVYRTGDLGRFDADGVLHYSGRLDRQLKVRGHRVEPGEIETHAARIPGVSRCAVVPRMEGGACVGMVAAYTVEPGARVSEEHVRGTLARQLPTYLVPDVVRAVDAFPLTSNGKLDATALAETLAETAETPAAETVRVDSTGRRPSAPTGGLAGTDGPVRTKVAHAFAELLGTADVPPETSFFELGGSSLDGARLCTRIGTYTGVPVPASVLVAQPTVRALADWVEARVTAEEGRPPAAPADGPVPLTPMQSGFLFAQRVDPQDTSSHCELVWRVEGDFDAEAFRTAVDEVHRRHESLRARYVFDRVPVAKLDDAAPLGPDLRTLAASRTLARARAELGAALRVPLDIGNGHNWRCVIAPVAPHGARTSWLVGVVVHHIAFDGGSEQPFTEELSRAYAAAVGGHPLGDARPVPLARVLAGYRAQVNTATLREQQDHWRHELANIPTLSVPPPTNAPPTNAPAGDGAADPRSRVFALSAREFGALEHAAQRLGSTRFAVMLAAYGEALAAVTGDRDFAVGAPVAKRYHPDTERALCCLIDVLCFRLRPRGDGAFSELPRHLAGIHAGLAAQDVPFEEVVRLAAGSGRDRSRHPLFQTLFALQNVPPPALSLEGCATEYVHSQEVPAIHELEAEVWPSADGGAEVALGYRPDKTTAAFAAEVAQRYRTTLLKVVEAEQHGAAHT